MIRASSRALPYGFYFLPHYYLYIFFLSLKGTGCVEIIEERALEDHVSSLKENTQIVVQFMSCQQNSECGAACGITCRE